jgi:hypothetical protein
MDVETSLSCDDVTFVLSEFQLLFQVFSDREVRKSEDMKGSVLYQEITRHIQNIVLRDCCMFPIIVRGYRRNELICRQCHPSGVYPFECSFGNAFAV